MKQTEQTEQTEKFIKYPSIEQFRTTIKNIIDQERYIGKNDEGNAQFDYLKPLGSVKFYATTKVHGTNAAFCYDLDNDIYWVQSRTNIITPQKDNMGCATFCEKYKNSFINIIKEQAKAHNITSGIISLYFEFAGKGIQKGVAVSELEKRAYVFFHFKHTINEEVKWYKTFITETFMSDSTMLIHHIAKFGLWEFEVDLNNPEKAQNDMIKLMQQIEEECPVGAYFGIKGLGEGLVFEYLKDGVRESFKVKGEKHAGASKVKILKELDPEKLDNVEKCISKITHIWRFAQAMKEVFGDNPIDVKKIGEYLKWVNNDTIKEELDIIVEHNLEPKDIFGKLNIIAKKYFFEQYNAQRI